jgi:hypothetical protein
MKYAVIIFIAFIILIVAVKTGKSREEPGCQDCERACTPYQVIRCIPTGLGPRCECKP